jgi:SAM-dependent methyltransferase
VRLLRRPRRFRWGRRRLARRHLRGSGIEIGALNEPLPLPRAARVRYLDRLDVAGLRREYPELAGERFVQVDIVDDGERLSRIEDSSLDFIVANHFIEHTEDPIGTIESSLRALRPGGILFMAVPDKRRTFDRGRRVTEVEHLLRDHREGPQSSRGAHYEEWAREVMRAPDPEAEARGLRDAGTSIHFHVWTRDAFGDLLAMLRDSLGLPFEVEAMEENRHEFIAVLRKLERAPARSAAPSELSSYSRR